MILPGYPLLFVVLDDVSFGKTWLGVQLFLNLLFNCFGVVLVFFFTNLCAVGLFLNSLDCLGIIFGQTKK